VYFKTSITKPPEALWILRLAIGEFNSVSGVLVELEIEVIKLPIPAVLLV
jgi:hypothetical protein